MYLIPYLYAASVWCLSVYLSNLELYTRFWLNSHKEQLLNIELNSDQMSHGIFLCLLRAALRVRRVETAEWFKRRHSLFLHSLKSDKNQLVSSTQDELFELKCSLLFYKSDFIYSLFFLLSSWQGKHFSVLLLPQKDSYIYLFTF